TGAADSVDGHRLDELVADAQPRRQGGRRILRDEADAPPPQLLQLAARQMGEIAPREMDRAGADPAPGPLESEQGERRRRLAAAGLADQSERLSARKLERGAVDDVVPAVVRPEVDRQSLDLDE